MNADDNSIGLSRRKMLAGLGAIGVASAGAGLGTTAYFSDTETFQDNSLTAGTLDMSVTAEIVAADDYWTGQGVVGLSETADGDIVTGIQVDDVKPGDWAIICFDIEVGDNPGYVQVRTENFTETGGANPGPEQDVEGDDDNDADLAEFLLTTVWQDYDDASGDKTGLSGLDPVFNNNSNALGGSYAPSDVGGVVDTNTHYTNASEADATLSDGYIIKNSDGAPIPINDNGGVYSFCLLLEVPFQVGNVIQGDTLGFDLVFETEQVRHNDDPFNNSAPVNTTPS
ncbi:SipW-dependent-type signal peptide-containing protein [Halorubrum halophilum]|uniref:SipW-dependent-type signal peptide-containing protein n=1 Tax=Halorubrum halophilum TaxID=413816 RepID=UPI0006793396|nr:SipW-dependent-type signal peptide-containing protein [Halorubrum halophilum]